jgi:opacity protein-like surface antigen
MRNIAYLLGLGLVLSSGVAAAADLPTRKEAPPPPVTIYPVYNWSGFYLGGYAGVAFTRTNLLDGFNGPFNSEASSTAFTAGVLGGYNFQWNEFVGGAEADFGYYDLRKSGPFLNANGKIHYYDLQGGYIGRLRLRAGYALNNWLLFAAGGLSLADEKLTLTNPVSGNSPSATNGIVGFNLGVGAEYAVTKNVLVRLEYIYDDFGRRTYNYTELNGAPFSHGVQLTDSTIRAGIEYKF